MKQLPGIGKNPGTHRFSGYSKTAVIILSMLSEKQRSEKAAPAAVQHEDEPLPATLTFVAVMGVVFAALWFAMFVLLHERW